MIHFTRRGRSQNTHRSTASRHPTLMRRQGVTQRAPSVHPPRHECQTSQLFNRAAVRLPSSLLCGSVSEQKEKSASSCFLAAAAAATHVAAKLPRRKWPVRVDRVDGWVGGGGDFIRMFPAVSYSFVWAEQIAGNGIQIESSCLLRSLNPPSP